MILVVGATGALGTEICVRLREGGNRVRAFVRPGSPKTKLLKQLGAEIAMGDLKDPASVAEACKGAGTVVSTATCIISKRSGDTLKAVDYHGQTGLLQAAKLAGAGRFLFVSAHRSTWTACPFVYYKQRVENALRASGMAWTILQPSAFMETSFSPLAGWDVADGKARIFGSGENHTSYISLEDVAAFAAAALSDSKAENRVLPLGGAEALTQLEAVRLFEEAAGRPFRVTRAPVWLMDGLKKITRPFNPRLSSILTICAAAARDNVVEMGGLLEEFPMRLATVREFARQRVAELNSHRGLVAN